MTHTTNTLPNTYEITQYQSGLVTVCPPAIAYGGDSKQMADETRQKIVQAQRQHEEQVSLAA